jgi:hypothetical protein
MAIGITVSVNYTINSITKSGSIVEVFYTLTNSQAPLTKKYMNVFDLETFYEGIGSTTTYSDAVDYVETNFSGLAYTTMSTFADTARLIILNSIGSTAGTAVTGVVSFGLLNNPIVTLGLTPFTFDFTFKAGI